MREKVVPDVCKKFFLFHELKVICYKHEKRFCVWNFLKNDEICTKIEYRNESYECTENKERKI